MTLLVLDEIAELCYMEIVDEEGLYSLTSFSTMVEFALGLFVDVVAVFRLFGELGTVAG